MYRTLADVSTPLDMSNASYPDRNLPEYRPIQTFAPDMKDTIRTDPLFYCLLDTMDSQFIHGSTGRIYGKYNENCSHFLTNRCALKWDPICEAVSKDKTMNFPNTGATNPKGGCSPCLAYGDQIVRNAALQRFKVASMNCNVKCEPHDPLNPESPLICYETSTPCNPTDKTCFGTARYGTCKPVYKIAPEQIPTLDQDPLMNKILEKPQLAYDMLFGIYETMRAEGTLRSLDQTKLGRFLKSTFQPN